jgi:hypothetical protein
MLEKQMTSSHRINIVCKLEMQREDALLKQKEVLDAAHNHCIKLVYYLKKSLGKTKPPFNRGKIPNLV